MFVQMYVMWALYIWKLSLQSHNTYYKGIDLI